jgi:hypothetical protein
MALALGAASTALLLGGLGAGDASSTLVSPMPSAAVATGMATWLLVGGTLVLVLGRLALPRLARRLLTIGLLALTGWSSGTMGRALYVTVAFAFAESVEEEATPLLVTGTPNGTRETQSLAATSLEHRRTLSVPFDADAAEEIAGPFTCITLPLERTASGVARLRLPDEPLGVDDLASCPAQMPFGR